MTEALRMVKRAFGDDAVILSAKEVRPGGFFSALKKKSVEITAAADYPVDNARDSDDFSGLLSKHLDAESEDDRVSLSTPLPSDQAFTRHVPPFSRQLEVAEKQGSHLEKRTSWLANRRISDKANPGLAERLRPGTGETAKTGKTAVNGPIRCLETGKLVADPFYGNAQKRRVIALVGPPGVGKSTTVAKLARHCLMVEKKRTGLISLDRFGIMSFSSME
ncbi:MAG: hypothetical protein QNK35_03555 [Bacteroides sp.]|nr:hypothetical protein [Bacteroides sp.]